MREYLVEAACAESLSHNFGANVGTPRGPAPQIGKKERRTREPTIIQIQNGTGDPLGRAVELSTQQLSTERYVCDTLVTRPSIIVHFVFDFSSSSPTLD